MKYLNNNFYTECKNDKNIIQEGKVFRETVAPKSLKTRNEAISNVKQDKNKTVIELDDGSLVLVDSKKTTTETDTDPDYIGFDAEKNFILRNTSMCMKCGRNLLLEYATEFVCLSCNIVIDKTKQQLTKLQANRMLVSLTD